MSVPSSPPLPLASGIMATYNCEATVHDAVTSIVDQAYSNGDLVISDGGSTGDTIHEEPFTGVFENLLGKGQVLVTRFATRSAPPIRYGIGNAIALDANDECGRGLGAPNVPAISGPKGDSLHRADGAKINGGNVANPFKNMPNALIRAQLVQDRIDEVRILLEVDEERHMDSYDELLRESSGKHRLIKNSMRVSG